MNKILPLAAAAVLLAGCGGASAPKSSPATTASPSAMSLFQACQALRASIVANGGTADKPTLDRIAQLAYSTPTTPAGQLGTDAFNAEADIGKDTWPLDAAILHHDCNSTGVAIPDGLAGG